MDKTNFNTDKAPRMSQVFPQAVFANKFIFLSGTTGLDITTGQLVSDDFAILNIVYSEFFGANAPARSTPQVMPFPAGILISIECVALL